MSRTERSSEEIRRDIERTRADMDDTVEELESRLSPGQLLDQAWSMVKGGGGGGVVKDHPVPLALMGLGVAWLAVEKATGDGHHGEAGTYGRAGGRVGPYGSDAVDHDDSDWAHNQGMKEKASGAAHSMKDKASGAAHSMKEKASDAASTAKGKARDLRDRAGSDDSDGAALAGSYGGSSSQGYGATEDDRGIGERAGQRAAELQGQASHATDRAREEARHRTRQAKQGFWSMMEDNPLALGAVAFGVGLAGGLAAPTTEWEDRVMGDTAETLKSQAKQEAKETGRQAKRVAEDTAQAVKGEADRQGIGDDLKESAKRVAQEAKSTAKESAEREGLDAESVKGRARNVGEKTRDSARDQTT